MALSAFGAVKNQAHVMSKQLHGLTNCLKSGCVNSPTVKWLASFLAILVLLLSVQPVCAVSTERAQVDACCADDVCEEESDGGTSDEGDCKGCNPFQSCSCCTMGVIVPVQSFALQAMATASLHREWSQHVPGFPAAVYGDFWQPPKLG